MRGAISALDAFIGDGVGAAIRAHHRRRLAALGWAGAVDPPAGGWAAGVPPPRGGNAVDVLVDGASALPRIAAAVEAARSHVHVAGWYFSPEFQLTRDDRPAVLRNLLAAAAQRADVRVLMWAGAPLPLLRPWRGDVRGVAAALSRETGVRTALDAKERPLHCHHEKIVIVDDAVAFVGGIDLTVQDGDRFDSSEHSPRAQRGWHDVATELRGPIVADVAAHFGLRWAGVTGETLTAPPAPAPAGDVEAQLVRTVPEHLYPGCENGDFRILESYIRAFRSAERLIYFENQFLWSAEIARVLADKLRNPPRDDFRVVAVLPATPTRGGDDTRGVLAELVDADGGSGRLVAATIYAHRGPLVDPVYVHAKVAVVDDRWLTVGSANLNEHSLFNDTEVNVVTHDAALARATRLRLWSEHLERPVDEVDGDPADLVERFWKPISRDGLERLTAGRPLQHRLVRLPGVSRRSARLLGPLQGLTVDA
jgi:phosphatidylserine/phosphatidylglycerophosphate/cardiolipin synthase-like enzyme